MNEEVMKLSTGKVIRVRGLTWGERKLLLGSEESDFDSVSNSLILRCISPPMTQEELDKLPLGEPSEITSKILELSRLPLDKLLSLSKLMKAESSLTQELSESSDSSQKAGKNEK